MSNFHVGQQVVCIDPCAGIIKGEIYTVSRVGVGLSGVSMIDVAEADWWSKHVPAYLSCRFLPVAERKTDISIFTAMLDTQRTGVPA